MRFSGVAFLHWRKAEDGLKKSLEPLKLWKVPQLQSNNATHIACIHAFYVASMLPWQPAAISHFICPRNWELTHRHKNRKDSRGRTECDTETGPSEQHPPSTYSHPSGCKFGLLELTWQWGLKCVSSALRECSDCMELWGPILKLKTLDLTLNQLDSGRFPKN